MAKVLQESFATPMKDHQLDITNQFSNSKISLFQQAQPKINKRQNISIVFKNISYLVQIEKKSEELQLPCRKQKQTKTLLKNVSGIFKAGQVSAIMGASGAGKTTLLNILACRIAKTEGTLLVNQKQYSYDSFGDFANYVMQGDVLMQTLTVRETLHFAANLRLNANKQDKIKKIQELAKSMKLEKCLDVLVGGPIIKGISGGEKKRTSIAFELISQPQVIMLDQPTSGLDSLTSFIIVDYLSKLAHEEGRTVLMTIHQPNSDIFQRFDRLFLMIEGQIIYQGQASQAVPYFSDNFGLKFAQFQNSAQFFIANIHHQDETNVKRYPEYFKTYSDKILPKIQKQIQNLQESQIQHRIVQIPLATSFSTLLSRDLTNVWRNPMIIKSRIMQSLIMAIYVGGLYFNAGKKSYTSYTQWMTIAGYFFFLCIANLMTALSPVTLIFPTERAVFLKQQNSRLYSVLPYFISRNMIELPYIILFPLLFNCIIYWMVGQASTAEQFFKFYLVSFLIQLSGNSLGLLLGSVISDVKAVSAATPIILLPVILFSGFFKNRNNLPVWIGWIEYISPIKYGFISMMKNQTANRLSFIDQMNFDLQYWPSIFTLLGLSIALRVLSLFFLWLLRTKLQ